VIPLRKRRAGIPRDLETILLRALEPEPRRRFASAAELAAELEAFLGDRPITSRRPSPIERWWRWQRRNPLLGAALLALALCLLALGVGSTFAATSFRQAAHELLLRSQSEERLRLDLAAQLSSSEIARAFRALQDPASHGELAQIVSREKARRGGTLPPSWEWRLIDAVASQRHRECGGPEDGLDVLGLQPGGRWLAAAGSSLHFFDTVEERWHPERDVSLRSAGLSWNASGRYLGIASVGAHVLDFETGELVCDLGEPEVDRIAMHPHRPLFAVALRTRDLVLYDWREQREILRLERALVPLWRFGFSPSGDELAFLCPSGVGILRIEDGSVRHLAYREVLFHMPVIWHPSGKVIAMGIADGAALLDARNGTLLRVLSTGSRFPVDLAFDEAGRRMALTARDNAIHLFGLDPETLLEPQPTRTADRVLSGIETSTSGARIDARGQRVYAGARSRPLHVWDLDDAAPFRSFGTRTASGPYIALGLHWEETSRSLWSSTRAGARCWSPTGEALGESMVGTRTPTPSADERWLALVSGSRLRVLDRNTRQLFREAEHAAHFLAWHPREPRLYSADPFEIRAWELRNESTPRTLGRSELRLFDMDLSADGRFLWFARGEDFAGFDTESGIFHPVERPDAALGVVIVEAHPQAPLVACGYDDGSFQVYDAELRRFHPRRKGHGLRIRDFAWSPDGARLASVSSDASIRLWDPLRGEELATLRGPCVMAKVCWSNDGDVLAALSDEGHILVWDAGAAEAESLPR
jgi:WD40 repeat protein